MSTTEVYRRLERSVAAADQTLTRTETLLAQFNRRAHEKTNEKIATHLRGALCDGCNPSYCAVAGEAYYLEGQGVYVEPQPCLTCDGWRLIPSGSEVRCV